MATFLLSHRVSIIAPYTHKKARVKQDFGPLLVITRMLTPYSWKIGALTP